jgi:RNA polymerase sigma-70 factor (ECF subfamily)
MHAEADPTLDQLYRRYFPLLREKCRRMVGDTEEAGDIAQETFVRFWRERARLVGDHACTAWLYRTSTRLAVDRMRRRKVRRLADPTDVGAAAHAGGGFDPEAAVATRRLLVRLGELVSADDLQIALLAWLDGLTQIEIGEVLGITERTIRRRMRRIDGAMASLRKELAR